MSEQYDADIVIIGTGAGGGTLAHALMNSGARVLVLERGGFLPTEPENWSATEVFANKRYRAPETWFDGNGRPFRPGVHYFVGGSTKVYGSALPRFRRDDFEAYDLEDGVSPAWPIGYDDLEPYYEAAERMYRVHGTSGQDLTEPSRRTPYPFPEVPDEPVILTLRRRLTELGLHPYSIPLGIDLRTGGLCIRCSTCDGFPCHVLAKSDADTCGIRPALLDPQIQLKTNSFVERLECDPTGRRVVAAVGHGPTGPFTARADRFIVSCGAVNSAALLLRSAMDVHPAGLANSSRQVGRNYMQHVSTAVIGVGVRRNPTRFQKTIAVNDYYYGDDDWKYRMGSLWLIGKVQGSMLAAETPLPRPVARSIATRSVDWWACSEDVPVASNRVTLGAQNSIRVAWEATNQRSHRRLVAKARTMLRRSGYPLVLTRHMGIATNSHQCGTVRFGDDPATSVLDPLCRTHDVDNLYVVDSSFFPSSGTLNPVLTIAAQALRVADQALKAS